MTNTPNLQSADSATIEELTEIIGELEQYRQRLVADTMKMAQKAKITKKQTMANLEPSLAQIDANLEALRQRLETASSGN
ncbi:hypothetical protein Pse7367_3916 (plasmid) [Thalassoporum mexicanum PCC 7367]|uniref:hypothetical protein n=1 Tax=Thalassoporum mexicanum TaxID=3457544 RepID=UPI00029FE4B2|nr:hypothetical protein [Pseudanabaena sp. PCC 7367]AFY72133.1 hypothetical protein Pse7367_3916 [Pseudanabaena sp. PCC 7367]